MVGDILRVKTRIPPIGRTTLERSSIHERLDDDLLAHDEFVRRLTLVSAPAGYGKTTLVRTWLKGREDRTAWYSIDADDDAPQRYWAYVVAALQTVAAGMGQTTLDTVRTAVPGGDGSDTDSSYLTPLLNDLYATEAPIFLVLDDYHLINDQAVHDAMTFLLENAPPTLHLVATTRSDPPWPLAVWRARGYLAEVRARDLRFSEEDASSFFTRFGRFSISPALLARLCERTEGWATGLQLAALSLSTAGDPEGFVRGFTGSNRHVLHYLADEVYDRQSPQTRDFLLATSLLDRFCAELCDAVTGRGDAAQTLRTLDRDNLFVIALDDDGRWFRYHHLFADLLRSRAVHEAPERVPAIHERAARWFLSVGEPGEAVRHALAADRTEDVVAILSAHSYDVLRSRGSLHLFEALSALDMETLARNPLLIVHYALLCLVYGGRHEPDAVLEVADRAVNESCVDPALTGMLETAKAFHSISNSRLSDAVAHADKAVELLPPHNSYWRMNVAIYSGDARLFGGNPREAHRYYCEADLTGKALDHPLTSLTTSFKVATSLQCMGRSREAEQIVRDALIAARQRGHAMIPRAGLHWGLMGELLRERGELDEAESCVERGLVMSETERTAHGWTCLHALTLAISRAEYDRGADLIARIEAMELRSPLPSFVTIPACALAARVQLGLGMPETALARLAALHPRLAGPPFDGEVEAIPPGLECAVLSAVRVRLATGAANRCDRDVLREIERRAESGAYATVLIETRLVHAAVALAEDDVPESERLVRSAIEDGTRRGFFQTYADERPLLSSVYRNLARSADEPEAVRRLAARICPGDVPRGSDVRPGSETPQTAESMADLVEPLSPREIEILACVSRGLSNEETGEELFISAGTVKWHMANIFGKLGVGNRTRAAAVARKLGLIA
ncbi:MAG: hypothetical protein EA382_02500 [Spirochaetaceae bacterium]|nr:MAG: hypothetical protein EA382_02500 [Spirochaetaceae bacterium]